MTEDIEFQNMLRTYAAPVADNGFTAATLAQANSRVKWRIPILASAALLGAIAAVSQMPTVWTMLAAVEIPATTPFAMTAFGVLGFVGWAALDRGWSDTV